MKKPTFSIIVGCYNQQDTIGQLADALNQQSIQDFEVHLCDDGSSDSTKQIFESRLNSRIPYFYHRQEQKGMRLARNLNQGIKAANGEYCVFIMGDSFPEPTYLEVLSQFLAPHRLLCGVRYQVADGVGVDIDWRLKKNLIPAENVMLPSRPFDLTTGNGLLIPTNAMRVYGGWNEDIEGYGGDDYEVVARLYFKGYTVWSIVDAKLYHNWHIAKETNPTNVPLLKDLVQKYAGL